MTQAPRIPCTKSYVLYIAQGITKRSAQARDRGKASVYSEELLTSRPIPPPPPKLEDNPLSAVCDSLLNIFAATLHIRTSAYRGGVWGVQTPPKYSEGPPKSCQTETRLWKLLKIAELRRPTYKDVWKKGSKIIKLPSVRNCFTLAMTNKLVVIINSL